MTRGASFISLDNCFGGKLYGFMFDANEAVSLKGTVRPRISSFIIRRLNVCVVYFTVMLLRKYLKAWLLLSLGF